MLAASIGTSTSRKAESTGAVDLPRRTLGAESELAPLLDLSRAEVGPSGRYEVDLGDGRRAELTLDPTLQSAARKAMRDYKIPYAAAVVMSTDGRVLALVGESQLEPALTDTDLTTRAWAPAASVFKLVTGAALIEAGVSADTKVCYHGGGSGIAEEHLRDDARRDRDCNSLAFGIGKSQNAIMGKLAARNLEPAALAGLAEQLGWNQPLPFALPVTPSAARIPNQPGLAFARVAAGFWRTELSVLHGALLAETFANGGVRMAPRLVERVVRPGQGPDGGADVVELPVGAGPRRVLAEATAREVGRMMVGTTTFGTARASFTAPGPAQTALLGYRVAGKTGSLSDLRTLPDGSQQTINYNWFVGFAPADNPRIAIAVLVGNQPVWRVKAHTVAKGLIARALADTLPGAIGGPELAARDVDHTP
ncbi:MAG: penicillin-binding protein [Deltaproteobacteria bacterium]|nr:penicillin-binding protein [Deltaproteobacteria bacterium]